MASARDGLGPSDRRPADAEPAAEFVAGPAERELLDQILKETVLAEFSDDEHSAEDLRALRAVAARHPTAAFDLDPVAVELVRAVVGDPFRQMVGSQQAWQAMTYGIAQTLFDDPRSRQRLESLWHRLREAGQ